MKKIGRLVQEAMDAAGQNNALKAFGFASKAFGATAERHFDKERVSDFDKSNFFFDNWWLLHFLSMPYSVPVSPEIIKEGRRRAFGFPISDQIEDLLFYIVRHNIVSNGMPVGFGFNPANDFAFQHDRILIPERLVLGLIGVVIFCPINSDENIPGDYWFEFGGFRMFVSELWGRSDLVERVMKLT